MKCKWYAEFEGVCTNGECPYRGDTCPTSEYPEVCKYAEAAPEVLKLKAPRLSAKELAKTLRLCDSTSCSGCALFEFVNCESEAKQQAADMIEQIGVKVPSWNGGRTMKTDEIKLKPCPFCGSKVSLVLCDDEGNLHDEAYREHPYSGLGFMLHHAHEENPECPIASYECDGGILGRVYIYDTEEQAAEAWNRRVEHE